jgi:hypothetical protein
MLVLPLRDWVLSHTWLIWVALLLSIASIFAMIKCKQQHPTNMICLGAASPSPFQPTPPPPPPLPPHCSFTIALVCAAYAAQGQADTGEIDSAHDAPPLNASV